MPSNGSETTSVPAFIAKLWHMVSDPSCDHLISWKNDGASFVIKDQATFCSELLPTYYKHNNMASFIRQLNKYGFHKVLGVESSSLKNDKPDYEFAHPYFQRSSPAQLELIKRKLTTSSREVVDVKNDPNIISKLLHQVHELKAKQETFESRFSSMKNENDALWREHAALRQKHIKQQKIVNKLIEFLVSLIQQRGVNLNVNRHHHHHRGSSGIQLKDLSQRSNLKAIEARPRSTKAPSMIYEVDASDGFINLVSESDPGDETNDTNYSLDSPSSVTVTVSPHDVIPARVTPNQSTVVLPALSPLDTHSNNSNDVHLTRGPTVLSPTSEVEEEVLTDNIVLDADEQLITPDMIAEPVEALNVVAEAQPIFEEAVKSDAVAEGKRDAVDPLETGDEPDIFEELSDDKLAWSSVLPTSSGRLLRSAGSQGICENNECSTEIDKVLVLPDNSRQEIDSHIEIMQSDIDSLREILQELDSSSLMGMLNANNEDPLGNRRSNQQQLISFNPPPIDIADILDDDDDEVPGHFSSTSVLDENLGLDLNTPQPTPLSVNGIDGPPMKRSKKQ